MLVGGPGWNDFVHTASEWVHRSWQLPILAAGTNSKEQLNWTAIKNLSFISLNFVPFRYIGDLTTSIGSTAERCLAFKVERG